MKALKGSKTHDNLKAAFASESQANRRYLYFASKADVEGHNDVSARFRSTAEGETGHAHGHLEYLEAVGDPATNLPIGRTRENLKAAVAGGADEHSDVYRGTAKQAGDEPADRAHARQPEGGGGGGDARVHRHVPRDGEAGARRGLRRDLGLVRDARQGGAKPGKPLSESARGLGGFRRARQ